MDETIFTRNTLVALLLVCFLSSSNAISQEKHIIEYKSNYGKHEFVETAIDLKEFPQLSPVKAIKNGIPIANVFSVSKTSNHIAVQLSLDGEIKTKPDNTPSMFALLDLEGNVLFTQKSESGFWLTNSDEYLAYNRIDGERLDVVVLSKKKALVIEGAVYPSLWKDKLAYSYADCNEVLSSFDLTVLYLASGKEKRSKMAGIMPDFSPNGYNVCFLLYETIYKPCSRWVFCNNGVDYTFGPHWGTMFPLPGKKLMQALDPPKYYDYSTFAGPPDHILFQTMTSAQQNCSEVYSVYTFERHVLRFTQNDTEEYFPQLSNGGRRAFYLIKDGDSLALHYSSPPNNPKDKGNQTDSGIRTPYFRVLNDWLLYLNIDSSHQDYKTALYGMQISDLLEGNMKTVDLTEKVRKYLRP